ncbi:MAG TPA: hypothetical protein VGN63_15565 [Flavisolibacter sp.]|jgi:hypothetical protein|nr:hypothetical protein [Flavisolibacter sp.]
MNLVNAIEGGLAGASTISLLGETLRNFDGHTSDSKKIKGKNLKKLFKKASSQKPMKAAKQFIGLAGDLLGSTAFLRFTSLGKRKHAMLRGAILGTAAGLGAVFLNDHQQKEKTKKINGHEGYPSTEMARTPVVQKAVEVGLFTLGGLLAGRILQSTGSKNKKAKSKKK